MRYQRALLRHQSDILHASVISLFIYVPMSCVSLQFYIIPPNHEHLNFILEMVTKKWKYI